MAYGKIKADTLVYDNSGTDTDVTIASLGAKADLNSPTFTGTPTVPGYAALSGATFTGNVVMSANLTVQGTTTTISSTTIEVADKNLELGKVDTPTDTTADGGGITLKGATDKTFNWVDATDAWTSSEHIHLEDNKKLLVGTGSDLSIYHNGSNSFIDDQGTGNLYISSSDQLFLRRYATNETFIKCIGDGAVELYHDNSKKIETTAAGVTVSGTVSDSVGDVRKLGYTSTSSAYTLLQSDNGKFIEMGGGGVTAPSGMAAGTMITIINTAASDQTITQGSNFTLTNSADASTGNRTLASKGMATILFTGSANGFISGAGLS